MMNFTPTPSHSHRIDLVLTLAGFIGIILFVALYDQAFPEAAIDLTLSRAELEQRASAYLQARGYDVSQYESALTFYESSFASTYLQRTFGVAETNRRVRADRLPI
jgi:hypothetical protein